MKAGDKIKMKSPSGFTYKATFVSWGSLNGEESRTWVLIEFPVCYWNSHITRRALELSSNIVTELQKAA